MALLPCPPVSRLLTHRFNPGIHGRIVLTAGQHLPLRHQPIAGDQSLPVTITQGQDRSLIVLPDLFLPVVTRVIDTEIFHQDCFGRRDVVDTHGQPLFGSHWPFSSGQPQPSIIRHDTGRTAVSTSGQLISPQKKSWASRSDRGNHALNYLLKMDERLLATMFERSRSVGKMEVPSRRRKGGRPRVLRVPRE